MTKYTFIAEASNGATIKEQDVTAASRKEARGTFWNGLTDEQRDACASIECVDEVAA